MLRKFLLTLTFSLALLAPAAAASAQTYPGNTPAGGVLSSGDTRGDGAVAGVTASRPAEPAPRVRSTGLALTGTDVAQLAVLGLVLVSGGVVLVRRTRQVTATA